MTARDYQTWAVAAVWEYFRENTGNPVIAMPTGTGKSHVIADLLKSIFVAYPRSRAMMLTHVKELISQNYSKFLAGWPNAPAGIYSAGLNKKDHHNAITFGGIGSVAKKAALFGHIDLLFIDECDLVSDSEKTQYNRFIGDLKKKNPALKVIGLTATPWRAGLGAITNEGGLFTDVCVDMTGVEPFNWFIQEGYLVPLIPKPTKLELDVSGVHLRGGEFIQAELQQAVDKQEITHKALLEAREIGHNRHSWLVFASGVEHAKHIAAELNAMGIEAAALYSGIADSEREKAIDDFKCGKLRALVNNNILTTGFDAPCIDMILMLRPTGSSRLWVQMLGRGTRPFYADGYDLSTKEGRLEAIAASSKQNCLVLDFAANIRKLGPINDPVIPRQKGKGPAGEAPIKLCLTCNTYNHASVRHCFNCGSEFVFVTKLKVEASTQSLIKGEAEMPIVESFKVDHITYTVHTKAGLNMLKVTYYCGLKSFTDYVCVEHPEGNYALRRAREWWRLRSEEAMPRTIEDAMEIVGELACPTHVEVWINQKFPSIQRYCFDGSNFGRAPASESLHKDKPQVTWTNLKRKVDTASVTFEPTDDDIPF